MKNTLATIQALAAQTLKTAPAEEKSAFVSRLHALSEAHDLLTQNDWDTVGITGLARRSLSAFSGAGAERIVLDGPEVGLGGNKALMLTMILHELGTNAIKYGSLSGEKGRVALDWHVAHTEAARVLRLNWRESGGPRVVIPESKGFGSRMIVSALRGNEGSARFDYRETGLEVALEMRL